MNHLPPHRSALMGRTWSRSWRPADWAAIEHPQPVPRWERIGGALLAVGIGIALGVLLVRGLS
jgi:hypothetical protein